MKQIVALSVAFIGGTGGLLAATFGFTNGDLILGFQATNGTGASQNVFFNLGSAVSHRDNANKGKLGNLANTLSFIYGSNWYTREDLYFGAIANFNGNPTSGFGSTAAVNGDPSRTFYITQPALVPTQAPAIAEATYPSAALGSGGTLLTGMEEMLVGTATLPGLTQEADGSAVLDQTAQSVEWQNGWTVRNPVPGAAFTVFTGGIQQNFGKETSTAYVDLFRLLATNTGAAPAGVVGGSTYVTSLGISSNGDITATSTALVDTGTGGEDGTDGTDGAGNTGGTDGTGGTGNTGGTGATGGTPTTPTTTVSGTATFRVPYSLKTSGARVSALPVTGSGGGSDPSGTPNGPEIVVEQATGRGLIDGKSQTSFGSVKIGTRSSAQVFRIRNIGSAPLRKISVSLSGRSPREFTVTKLKKVILAPGEATNINVSFKPKSAGSRSAVIRIFSTDKNESPFDIKLSGSGSPK